MSDYDEGYRAGLQKMRDLAHKRIEELEAKLAKVTTELKVLTDVSTFMQSSAYYDKRRYQSMITDTVWSQWSKQLKFAKGTIAELSSVSCANLKGQNDG